MAEAIPHLISITVIEARGLTGKDASNMSDAHIIIKVGPTSKLSRKTETKFKTVNAIWERNFILEDVMLTEEEFKTEKISFNVYDRNDFTRNSVIGSYEFSLENVHRQKGHEYYRKWVPLIVPSDPSKEQGFLLVNVYVLKPEDSTPDHVERDDEKDLELLEDPTHILDQRQPYILNVLIYKAQHVLDSQHIYDPLFRGKVNPFVSLRFNAMTIQTSKLSDNNNPTWNKKLELPFYLPLNSDSIEVQLWNYVPFGQDTLIGQYTFSYVKMRLTHRPFGPEWVNLYSSNYASSETSLFGTIVNSLQKIGSKNTEREHEYVGRLLVRLSVTPVKRNKLNPRLKQVSCNPAHEPLSYEYSLQVVLYQGSELPVMGGKIGVEIVFGPKRVMSRWVLGNRGVFKWNDILEAIHLYCPRDLKQIHDIFINVYHMSGYVSRKIAFERISAASLLPGKKTYYLNGEKELNEWESWKPRWRTMNHTVVDKGNLKIIPGFILCSIGFGLRKNLVPPKIIETVPKPYTLRCWIYHAGNLPIGDSSKVSSNPFLVIRYGDAVPERLRTVNDSVNPFWLEYVEMKVNIDARNGPSLFLSMYHEGTVSNELLGRSEVLTDDIMENKERIFKFPLFGEEHPKFTRKSLLEAKDLLPYVAAKFSLEEGHREFNTERKMKFEDKDFVRFHFKIEMIGLRNILDFSLTSIRDPILTIDFPAEPLNGNSYERKIKLGTPKCGNMNIIDYHIASYLRLPKYHLHAVPIRIKLETRTTMGLSVVGSFTKSVASFIDGFVEEPALYIFSKDVKKSSEDDVDEEIAHEEEERKMLTENQEKEPDRTSRELEPETLDLGGDLNITVIGGDSQPKQGIETLNRTFIAKNEEKKENIGIEIELRDNMQNVLNKGGVYYDIVLRRGKSVGIIGTRKTIFGPKLQGDLIGAVLKSFVRIVPEFNHSLEADNLLIPISKIYKKGFIARLYVWKGVHLTPTEKNFGLQTCNPYLIVQNGIDSSHVSIDKNIIIHDDRNPKFYQVFELPVTLPDNNNLEIKVMDKDDYGSDSFIGSTSIDVEWRLLNGLKEGEAEYRIIRKPNSSIAHGKLLMRLDLLTSDEARRKRAEDLRPPPPLPYELRMVVWATRDVKFPEEKDSSRTIDQKMMVTTNFSGEHGNETVKETDVAWETEGDAEWNHRMVWRVTLPSKIPRIKISLWDAGVVQGDNAIGEVMYNLAPLFARTLREKQSRTHQREKWLQFRHPHYRGSKLGEVCVEFWILTESEAEQYPVGEAQDEPNREPYLRDPHRKSPPWAVGSRGLEWLERRKTFIIMMVVLLPIIIMIVWSQMGSGSVI